MLRKPSKKLVLAKETLVTLSDYYLRKVAGGADCVTGGKETGTGVTGYYQCKKTDTCYCVASAG